MVLGPEDNFIKYFYLLDDLDAMSV